MKFDLMPSEFWFSFDLYFIPKNKTWRSLLKCDHASEWHFPSTWHHLYRLPCTQQVNGAFFILFSTECEEWIRFVHLTNCLCMPRACIINVTMTTIFQLLRNIDGHGVTKGDYWREAHDDVDSIWVTALHSASLKYHSSSRHQPTTGLIRSQIYMDEVVASQLLLYKFTMV